VEEFKVDEWLLIHWSVVDIHLWARQSPACIVAPLAVVIVILTIAFNSGSELPGIRSRAAPLSVGRGIAMLVVGAMLAMRGRGPA
jgi:hypothetical protein